MLLPARQPRAPARRRSEIAALLSGAPTWPLVVTSRELLQLQGEHAYAVPTLSELDGTRRPLLRAPRLRATATRIGELCRRLDNLPLAVELAAARTRHLSPAQLLERLSQRLDLLKGGRDADPRQQTLRATIEWRYDLLDERSSSSSPACPSSPAAARWRRPRPSRGRPRHPAVARREEPVRFVDGRYWMLETIREYAAERLEDIRRGKRHPPAARGVLPLVAVSAGTVGRQRGVSSGEFDPPRARQRARAVAWLDEAGEFDLGMRSSWSRELLGDQYSARGLGRGGACFDGCGRRRPAPSSRRAPYACRAGCTTSAARSSSQASAVGASLAIYRDAGRRARGDRDAALATRCRSTRRETGRGACTRRGGSRRPSRGRVRKGEPQARSVLADCRAGARATSRVRSARCDEALASCEEIGVQRWHTGALATSPPSALESDGRARRASTRGARSRVQRDRHRRGFSYLLDAPRGDRRRRGRPAPGRSVLGAQGGRAGAGSRRPQAPRAVEPERVLAARRRGLRGGRRRGPPAMELDDAVARSPRRP